MNDATNKATETLITHMWSTMTEAKRTYPIDTTIETVSGTAHATRFERTKFHGLPAIAVYGHVTTV